LSRNSKKITTAGQARDPITLARNARKLKLSSQYSLGNPLT
jgi:hypothetical protein